MRCPECGQRLADDVKRCPSCGAAIDPSLAILSEDERPMVESPVDDRRIHGLSTDYGEYHDDEYSDIRQAYRARKDSENDDAYGRRLSMVWYKFLIYVSLLLTSVWNIGLGGYTVFILLFGDQQAVAEEYAAFPQLYWVDIAFGVISVLFGFYAFHVRQELKNFKKKGPVKLAYMYVISIMSQIVSVTIQIILTGTGGLSLYLMLSVLTSVVMIIVNKIYFDNRKHLFIN